MPGSGYVPWDLSGAASLRKHLSKPWEILEKSVNQGDRVVHRRTSSNLSKWSCLLRSRPCGKLCSTGLPMLPLFLDSCFGAVCGICGPFVNRLNGGKRPFSRLHVPLHDAQQSFTDKAGEGANQSAVQKQEEEEPRMCVSIFIKLWPHRSAGAAHGVTCIGVRTFSSLIAIYLSILHQLSSRYRSVSLYRYNVIDTCHCGHRYMHFPDL